jgi:2-polyprenyl-6-methoxyphenol hydroxylase-like FAD-dependent oxidoreductase
MDKLSNKPVVIVGAGPVGLTTACLLHHFGIPFMIFDKKSKKETTKTSNALLINMQTLQLLRPLGIAAKWIESGLHLEGISLYGSNKHLARVDVDDGRLPFNYQLILPQSKTEQILRAYLKDRGIQIQLSSTLKEYTVHDDDSIELTIATPQKNINIKTAWLLACDGYHSTVRNHAKIKGYQHSLSSKHFVMIDATWTSEKPKKRLRAFLQPNISLGIIPYGEKGQSRLLAEVGRSAQFNHIDLPTLEDFKDIAKSCVPFPHQITNMVWSSKFSVVERIANQFQIGNIFLLGDAAHSHSPAGGMGMNTGIQDAVNLCWKLNMVYHNHFSSSLLHTYHLERRHVAKKVVSASNTMTRMMSLNNLFLFTIRNFLLMILMKFNKTKRAFLETNNQFTLRYPINDLVYKGKLSSFCSGSAMPEMNYKIDDVLLSLYDHMDYKHFYVLCFNKKDTSETLSKKIGLDNLPIKFLHKTRIFLVNKYRPWPKQGFIVVRPDAYIALSTTSENQVIHYFKTILAQTSNP